jgi:hypothetical protein
MIFVAPVGLAVRGIHKREKDPTKRWPDTRDKNRDLIKLFVLRAVCVCDLRTKQATHPPSARRKTEPCLMGIDKHDDASHTAGAIIRRYEYSHSCKWRYITENNHILG